MHSNLKTACMVFALITVAACTTMVRERVIVHDQPAQQIVVRHPPAPIEEVIPVAPAAGANWVSGHWIWLDTKWAWIPGHWHNGQVRAMPPLVVENITVIPAPHTYWVPGHWKFQGNDWVWIKGRWYY